LAGGGDGMAIATTLGYSKAQLGGGGRSKGTRANWRRACPWERRAGEVGQRWRLTGHSVALS
jgi:hypothetical protein